MSEFFVHPTSIVDDNVEIGEGTKIWHFSHGEAWYYLGNLEMNSTDPDRYEQAMEYYKKAYECGYGPGLVGQAMLYWQQAL